TEDPEIIVLFKFLNPNLKLPGHHTLSRCILSLYSEELQHQYIVEAKKHETGKVLVWGAEDISVKDGKTNNIIVTIKNFFIQAEIEELETDENEEIVIEDNLESSINDISEEWKAVLKEWSEGLISEKKSVEELESLFETEKLEETEALFFNELLTGLKHPADDPIGK
ncbi:41638_t:CDS:2, partial [Gigaspora margarita]